MGGGGVQRMNYASDGEVKSRERHQQASSRQRITLMHAPGIALQNWRALQALSIIETSNLRCGLGKYSDRGL